MNRNTFREFPRRSRAFSRRPSARRPRIRGRAFAALEIVAYEAVEDHQRAVFRRFQRFRAAPAGGSARAPVGRVAFDRGSRPPCCPPLTGGRNATSSPVSSGARQPEYSWFTEAAIDGAKFGQLRKPPPVALEKILDASAFGKLGVFLRTPVISLSCPKNSTRTRIAAF